MDSDFKIIVNKLSADFDSVELYCIADIHIGSPEFDEGLWKRFKKELLEQPNRFCIIAGDLFDCGLKNSKTNIYEQTMSVREQLDWLIVELGEIKDRILAVTGGNHSARITREVGTYPIYDICRILGIEDRYRPNLAFVKINFGQRKKDRQYSYTFGVHHGANRNKRKAFEMSIDGIDGFISGHVHDGEISTPAKISVDTKNNYVSVVPFVSVVCTSFLNYGGYGIEGMYLPKGNNKFQVLHLGSGKKDIGICWR